MQILSLTKQIYICSKLVSKLLLETDINGNNIFYYEKQKDIQGQ